MNPRLHIPILFTMLSLPLFAQKETALVIDASEYKSIQAAIDALPSTGGMVKLSAGEFPLKEPLIISSENTRITGAGAGTHLINTNHTGEAAIHLRAVDYEENPKSRIWRVQLDNFRVSGNELSGDGILAEGINEIYIHGLSVDHHGGHGINLVDCYENPRVADSMLTYNKAAGLHIDGGHDIVVNGNHFEENLDGVKCVDAFNLTMNGNNLDDHLRHGVIIENTYGSVISGNMIEECQGIGIVLDRDCYGITLSSNVIAHDFEGGIDLRDAWGCAISANTFTIVHEFGIRVGPDSGRITVTGNNFSNSYMGEGQTRREKDHEKKEQLDVGNGVLLENTEDVVISGNLFSGMDGNAIETKGTCSGIAVTGNVVTDMGRRDKVEGSGIQLEGDQNMVENNIFPRD